MQNVWEMYPELTEAVRKDHEGKDCGHHPFEHALMVAQYCLIIAEDERVGGLAAIAGLIHNTDRLFADHAVEGRIVYLLSVRCPILWYNNRTDARIVVDAVLKHSKKNDPSDSPVLVCLKDADRLANINPFDIIARAARHFPNLPLVDSRFVLTPHPDSTYRDPKTVFHDAIHSTLEWESWLRLPKAKKLAREYFDGLRLVQKLTSKQLAETGLDQYRS